MKKILLTIATLLLVMIGCTDQSTINSPVDNNSQTEQFSMIALPSSTSGMSVEVLMPQFKVINGSNGGTFTAYFGYQGGPFGYVKCYSQLTFMPGAFSGEKNISQTLDTDFASMAFGPSMQFNIPVSYTLYYSGLNLSNINPQTLKFVYIAPNGTYQNCEYDSITMDAATGTILVRNAKLNHFSRYGFVN